MSDKQEFDKQDEPQLPVAALKREKHWEFVWIFPLVAALIAGYLAYDYWKTRGDVITIQFSNVNNMHKGTAIVYRGITVGEVIKTGFNQKLTEVIVTARLQQPASRALTKEGTLFWVVEPQISLSGIKGLSTIIKGNYIRVLPGYGKKKKDFRGSMQPPSVAPYRSLRLKLVDKTAKGIKAGDPVVYKGVKVGQLMHVRLLSDRQVEATIYIEHRYRGLVHPKSVFWRQSGIHAHLGLFHSSIDIGSLRTLLAGAIEFSTPIDKKHPEHWTASSFTKLLVKEEHRFTLHAKNPAD